MIELQAWVFVPAVLYVLCLGVGLLAERLAAASLPNALLAPAGAAGLLVVITPVYRAGLEDGYAAGVALVVAAVGFVLARRSLRERLHPGALGLAGLAAYALYLAPVALSGHWSWAGYEFVNDTASNLVFAEHVANNGFTRVEEATSSTALLADAPVRLGYPLGAHFLLATTALLSGGTPLEAAYQPLMAAVAGLGAMALAQLARGAGLNTPAAAAAGVAAILASLLYRYVLHGAIKEILVVALLAATAAVGREVLAQGARMRSLALVALIAAPLLAVFSATGAVYAVAVAGPLIAVGLVGHARREPRKVLAGAAVAAAVTLAATLPTLADTVSFGSDARKAFSESGGASTAYMGQLLRPLPVEQAAGIWFARDYRLPTHGSTNSFNTILIAIVLVSLLAGIAYELRRRRPAAVLLFLPLAAVTAILAPQLSPYADAKLLVVLSPAVVLLSFVGVFAVWERWSWARPVALITGFAIAGGVLWSAAIGYREVQLAPPSKTEAMEDVADHARGGGLWLVNEWEEYAKYFMRDIRVNSAFEAESPRPAELRRPGPIFGHYYDLDEERLSYVTGFPGIIMRRSPVASRPPASFRMIYRNHYYEVWRRRADVRVSAHLPLQARYRPALVPSCAAVRRLAAGARPGERIVASARAAVPMLHTARARRDPGWVRQRDLPGVVVPTSPGRASAPVVARSGRYEVWIRGTFGRAMDTLVDGRKAGKADEINTREQWLDVGDASLRRGVHRLALERGGPTLRPGDAYRGVVGPLALAPLAAPRLVAVAPERAGTLCGRPWDWIERVRGPV